MGTNDFTFECWAKATAAIASGWNPILSIGGVTSGNGHEIRIAASNSNGLLSFIIPNDGSGGDRFGTTTEAMIVGNWYHLAIERYGLTVKFYINGQEAVAATQTLATIGELNHTGNGTAGAGAFWVNQDGWNESFFSGYVSNVRLVKGNAVYKGNFSVPTSPLTAVAGTKILLNTTNDANYLKDSSINAYTVTATGAPSVSSNNPF